MKTNEIKHCSLRLYKYHILALKVTLSGLGEIKPSSRIKTAARLTKDETKSSKTC